MAPPGADGSACAGAAAARADRATSRVAAAATPYALPLDSLAAVAEAAGLQWVNSDAAKIEAAQSALAADAPPTRVPREIRTVAASEDGPLVLVETKKDLSQVKLPFETAPARDARALLAAKHRSAPRLGPRRGRRIVSRRCSRRAVQGRRSSDALVRRLVHQLVPDDAARVCGSEVAAAHLAVGIGLPVACGFGREQLVEQGIDRRAAVERLVAEQDHVAAGGERERGRFGVAHLGIAEAPRSRHAQVVAEDRAVEAELEAQDLAQPARRKAGRGSSTSG